MADQKLPMRIGVGIIVLNNENKVFVGKRKDNPGDKWQMPQGGVDEGEDFLTAMKRELLEETGIKNIKIIKKIEKTYEYELPRNLVGIIWKGKYRGQKQKWFITKFTGNDEEINLHENFQQHLVHCCCKQQKNELLFTRQDGPNPFPSSPIIDKSTLSMIKISTPD